MSTNKPAGGAQFTPGPWVVETTNTLPGECADNVHRLCYPGYRIRGICAIWNNTRTSKANAALIAAAPAMYEALKEWCDYYAAYNPIRDKRIEPFIQLTRKALAQAEGRHPRKEETCK